MATSWESWQLAKRTAIEYLAVFIAAMAFIVTIAIFGIGAYSMGRYDEKIDNIEGQWAQSYKELEREYRLAQLEIDDFKVALAKAGIDTHDGEKP